MRFDRKIQILVAEKQFVHYNIYKKQFWPKKAQESSSFFKLPFKVFFFNFMFKDKLYVVLFIFIRIFSKSSWIYVEHVN
jgi:hypothetical protein